MRSRSQVLLCWPRLAVLHEKMTQLREGVGEIALSPARVRAAVCDDYLTQ